MRTSRATALEPSGLVLPAELGHALQPIVHAHSGTVWAYEALLRGTADAGFDSIDAFFDDAAARGEILATEFALFERAFAAFRRVPANPRCKLFLNVDGRLFEDRRFDPAAVGALADRMGVPRSSVCLELSEKHQSTTGPNVSEIVGGLRAGGIRIALDDFGQGYSELKLLYESAPEFVKIDRFFISDIQSSPRKRLFVGTIVDLAHVLGARVIAEGVETEEEFLACRHIGCDLVQGWYIARPLRDLAGLPERYLVPGGFDPVPSDGTGNAIAAALVRAEPLPVDTPVAHVLDRFRAAPDQSVFPVVDAAGEPIGYVHERDFRRYAYRPAGPDETPGSTTGRPLRDFVVRAPVVEMTCEVEQILAGVGHSEGADAVIVTDQMAYVGFVPSAALLRIVDEKRLTVAQDQNPLSRLPGNASINAFMLEQSTRSDVTRVFVYFDFNHFKPFNDAYGYRQGDRAIQLFADILRRCFHERGDFLGHIGGDDFFAGRVGDDVGRVELAATAALGAFRVEVESFYEPADRARGYLIAQDRQGVEQMFPLITASAAVIVVPAGVAIASLDQVSRSFAEGKRASKLARSGQITILLG